MSKTQTIEGKTYVVDMPLSVSLVDKEIRCRITIADPEIEVVNGDEGDMTIITIRYDEFGSHTSYKRLKKMSDDTINSIQQKCYNQVKLAWEVIFTGGISFSYKEDPKSPDQEALSVGEL